MKMNTLTVILAGFIYLWGLDDANALKTDAISLGRNGVYDGQVGIERREDGQMRLWDILTSTTLSNLLGGGGVSAHAALQGLANDDHAQYFNAGRMTTKLGIPGGFSGQSGWDFIRHIGLEGDAGGNTTLGDHIGDPVIHRGWPSHLVTVSTPGQGGTWESIADALSWIVGSGANNQYMIVLSPGVYQESVNLEKPYVFICGMGDRRAVVIQDSKSTAGTPAYGDAVVNIKPGAGNHAGLFNLTVKNTAGANRSPAVFVDNGVARIESCEVIGTAERALILNGGEYYVANSYVKNGENANDTLWTGATAGTFDGCLIETTSGFRMLSINGNDEHRFRFCQFNGSRTIDLVGGALGYAKFFASTDIDHVWIGDAAIEDSLTVDGRGIQPHPANYLTVSGEPGRADYTTIQAAVDAASDGAEIVIYPGEYSETLSIDNKGLSLIAAGPRGSVTITRTFTDPGSIGFGDGTVNIRSTGKTNRLERLVITNPGTGGPACALMTDTGSVEVFNCEISGGGRDAYTGYHTNMLMRDSRVSNAIGQAHTIFTAEDDAEMTFQRCTFHTSGANKAIQIFDNGTYRFESNFYEDNTEIEIVDSATVVRVGDLDSAGAWIGNLTFAGSPTIDSDGQITFTDFIQFNGTSTNQARWNPSADQFQFTGDGFTFDTNVYRGAANELKTDDAFNAASLKIAGTTALDGSRNATLGSVTIGGPITYPSAGGLIAAPTSDGADNSTFSIAGGGTAALSRGGYFGAWGNEHASNKGDVAVVAGLGDNSADKGQIILFAASGTALATYDGNTQRVGIGDLTPDSKLDVETDAATAYAAEFFNDGNNTNRYGVKVQAGEDAPSASDSWMIDFFDGDGGYLGSVAHNSSAGLGFRVRSDANLKRNVRASAIQARAKISQIEVVDWEWADTGQSGRGFVAQDMAKIIPDAVSVRDLPTTAGGPVMLIDYGALVPVMMKALQEQDEALEAQGQRIGTLEALVATMRRELDEFKAPGR